MSRDHLWEISYTGGYPGWLLHVVLAALMLTAPVWEPNEWLAWLSLGGGVTCLASAFAFRHRLEDADAWRTGERVPVGGGTYWWLKLHKAPLVVLVVASVCEAVASLLSRPGG